MQWTRNGWLACLGALLGLVMAPAAAGAADSLSIVSNGEVVGHVRSEAEGNRVTVDYLVDNNGRGPRHREEIVLGPGDIPIVYSIEGRSLMGGQVSESYRWENGRAVWRSQADSGDVEAAEPRLYVVNDGSPFTLGVYARALLADPDHAIDVLPGGQLRIEKVRDMRIGEGEAAVPVTIYRIDGNDMSPDYLMLDSENRLFATVGGSAAIREGYESHVPAIEALAETLSAERAMTLQRQLAHRFAGPVRIRNVRIFDPVAGRLSDISTVVVEGDRITGVVAGIETGSAPAGQTVIDGEGGTLVSGLHDMHSHNRMQSGLFYLAAGVTSVRDMGNDNDSLLDLVRRIEAGEVAGPRIVRNGFVEGRSPFSARNGFVVESEAEAVEAVRWYADHGYWQVKIYNSMNPAWVPAIAAEARRRGLGVTGHVPAFTTPDAMIRAGYQEIAHINQLMLGWLIEEGEDTRTPLRLTAMARGADLDLDSPKVQQTVDLMAERNIALDTTAVILERLMLSRAGTVQPGDAFYLDHMPIGYQRYRRRTFVPLESPEDDARYREGFQRILDTIALLHGRGIKLLPGTDDGTGFTVQRELELYQAAGIPPAEVLRIATLGMEEYLGRADELGSIEEGKLADFFLIAGDPTRDVSAIRRPRLVMRGGVAYLPNEIYDALGIRPFTEPPTIQAASGGAS
ncbi:amidohydrolase family protein [Sphingosinicella sp. CPCC 101087]|uniref:amidohydrolase family protein n=1 Tax=Sphingosinicella sp. CPCC 101087 TaxID=2497754 RepID=UPI001FB088FC|nr:amidohydrolase family protein [Sphingosinicella sp. CPCC 101087]